MRRPALVLAMVVFCLSGPAAAERPAGFLRAGYAYQRARVGTGDSFNLNGFLVAADFDLSGWLSLGARLSDYYASVAGSPSVSQSYTAGATLYLSQAAWLTPLGYVFLGDQRYQQGRDVTYAFEAQFGVALRFRLSHVLAIDLVPVEYDLTLPHGTVSHAYVASLGLVVILPPWPVPKGAPPPPAP